MAAEQTVYEGDDLKVVINVTNDSGSHVAATVNTTTTRVNGFSTVPTVNTIGTGQYEIVFTGLSPAPVEGDRLVVKVNGSIDGGSAWTEYSIPVIVKAKVVTAGVVADAVWDELFGDHLSLNSFGYLVRSIDVEVGNIIGDLINLQNSVDNLPAAPTPAQNAQAVWEYDTTTTVPASYGEKVNEIFNDTDENNTILLAGVDLSSSSLVSINAEVVDVLTVDTFAEPVSVPAATSSLKDMIHWNFTVARNKITQTSTTTTLRNDADSATIASAPVSDNGTTFTRGEYL